MGRVLFLMILFILSTCALANDIAYDHEIGWYWNGTQDEEKPFKAQATQNEPAEPIEQMNAVKKTIQTALDAAILEPTPNNVQHYIELQNQLSNRAQQFTNNWQQVLMSHPELNYSLTHPTSSIGLQVYHEEQSKGKDEAIAQFAKQTGLFFFYRSTCPYCHRFAPILKSFSEHYGIKIIAITMDGIPLAEFPDSHNDTGQSSQFHVTMTPSIFAVNPYTQRAYPVAYGLTSESELKDNIYKIIEREKGVST
jgi:conjugal transfer pilus assembly protein TraF